MTRIAFLISNRYQIHHYAPIARHLDDVTFVIEHREREFGVTPNFIRNHLPGVPVDHVEYATLRDLDGDFQVVVCQTPVLPNRLLNRSLVVAQQYSLAKEAYQYGLWRSLCSLNLMYGPYSLQRVQGFSPAIAVGNPVLDRPADSTDEVRPPGGRTRVLYAPTYGSLSSVRSAVPRLVDADIDVTVKLHHADDTRGGTALPAHWRVIGPEVSIAGAICDSDAVLSDMSGVIFDALALNRPVVIFDCAGADPSDIARLSSDEVDGSRLAELSARWPMGEHFQETLERASTLLEDHRDEFLAAHFVNLGSAGRAAAAAIEDLTRAPVRHPAPQVRSDATKLMLERSRFAQENRRLRRANDQLRGRSGRMIHKATASVAEYVRELVAPWPRVHRQLVKVKHRVMR